MAEEEIHQNAEESFLDVFANDAFSLVTNRNFRQNEYATGYATNIEDKKRPNLKYQ